MKHKRKKHLRHQIRRQKAFKFMATAYSVGMLGLTSINTPIVHADTESSNSSLVLESEFNKTTEHFSSFSNEGDNAQESTLSDDIEIESHSDTELEKRNKDSETSDSLLKEKVNEHVAGITYKVTYTDIESNTIVKSEHKSVAITTTEAIAATEVMEVASVPSGYKLAENQPSMLKATVTEKQRNTLNFNVVEDVESAVSVTRGVNFRSETADANSQPYGTIENYTHRDTYLKNGELTNISYKIGLTRIRPDEVELSADAALLGLTFDQNALYIKGTVAMTNAVEARKYNIGLVSKVDKSTIVNAEITVRDTLGFVLRPMGYYSQYMRARELAYDPNAQYYPINVEGEINSADVSFSENEVREVQGENQSINELTYTLSVPVTTFGHFIPREGATIADANETTKQYFAEIPLVSLDSIKELSNKQQKITAFKQLTGQDSGIELELIDLRQKTGNEMGFTTDELTDAEKELPGSGLRWSPHTYDENAESDAASNGRDLTGITATVSATSYTPYYLRFTKLPKLKGNYTASFKITDTIGKEKTITLNIETYEKSQSGALTHADLKFDGESNHFNAAVNRVQVPVSADVQTLGSLTLNKENATISVVSLPEGIEVNNQNQVIKKAGETLRPGVYTITAKALDGHFGDAAPVRSFEFEVIEDISPIGHQQWEEGAAIPAVPISLVGGTPIKALRVEADKEHVLLDGDTENSQVVGFGVKRTEGHKTATVYATYVNSEGKDVTVSKTFTYEVSPAPNSDLELAVTNANQTITEGETFKNMQITFTEGATITVDTNKLPKGTSYSPETRTISGKGLYEGKYVIPVTAEKEGKSRTTFVNLTVLPGEFTVEPVEVTIPVLEAWSYKLDIPDNISAANFYSLPEGVTYDEKTKTLSGTPTSVGTYYNNIYYSRPKGENDSESTYANFIITVKDKVASLEVEDRTVRVLSEMDPIQLETSEEATISIESSLPPGLYFDDSTKTIKGTPTKVGNYTVTARATYPGIQNSSGISKTFNIVVEALPATIDAVPENQTIELGEPLNSVLVTTNPEARLALETVFGELTGSRIHEYVNAQYGISYDPATKTFSGTPNRAGIFELSLKARNPEDLGGNTAITRFAFNVMDEELDLSLTNGYQSLPTGRSIREAVITHSLGSILKVDIASLPEGVTYHEETKTFSGVPTQAGNYQVVVTATNPRGTKNKKVTLTLDVFELPETPKEKSADPLIDKMIEGDTRVSGKGEVGAAIEVRLPDGSMKETTVSANGTWQIDPVPAFEKGHTVTVKQKEDGKSLSDAINSTAVARIGKGEQGEKGDPGRDGMNGVDGKSLSVVSHKEGDTTTIEYYYDTNGNGEKDEEEKPISTLIIKDGAQGEKGDAGAIGPRGPQGPKGDRGERGEAGPRGEQGEKGETGAKGDQGERGEVGPKGEQGERGEAGPKGEQGERGEPGRDGTNGVDGKDGKSITITKTEIQPNGDTKLIFSDGTSVVIPKGDKGEKGDPGNDGANGISVTITRTEPQPNGDVKIIFSDGKEVTIPKGAQGNPGVNGADGKSITITNTKVEPNGDVSVMFSDGTNLVVPKGKDGKTVHIDILRIPESKLSVVTFYYDLDGDGKFTPGIDDIISSEITRDGKDGKDGECACEKVPNPNGNDVTPPSGDKVPPTPGVNTTPPSGDKIPPTPGVNTTPPSGDKVPPTPGVNTTPPSGDKVPRTPGVNTTPPSGGKVPPTPGVNTTPPSGDNDLTLLTHEPKLDNQITNVSAKEKSTLPETGEHSDLLLTTFGLASMILSGTVYAKKRKE